MLWGISLVAILLALNYASRADRSSAVTTSPEKEWTLTSGGKVLRHAYDNVTSGMSVMTDITGDRGEDERTFDIRDVQDDSGAQSKIGVDERDRPRHRKRRDRTMIAMLLAYKLKFIALIPTMLGGLILLKGTTLLAGFFFALFAAVLGLKIH